MPQEGLNVFYRFFRDRISWFEADAVCQFHHANLVTVDNSFQFDATRDLLRELDVNDIVWIGLMRPQNSDRFMWSNSRPLVADTGYWAESLPLMDAPLCAVIDPIRDYRWHALRCGGPETASFLCEMPVPSWADACILKEMPNLTMQYMADTASIELIRNCQEEGLLRHTCKGKEDRERAVRELICPKERLEAQRINDITNSHFKSLQIIKSIRTDNNENNDIELLPLVPRYAAAGVKIEVDTVAPAERFSLDRLMMADEPVPVVHYNIPDQVPMPVKKSAKKVNINEEYDKKLRAQYQMQLRKATPKPLAHLDMMMGDQPALSEEQLPDDVSDSDVSNEIFEPLPHKKKVLPQDLRTMPTIVEATAAAAAATAATAATAAAGSESATTVKQLATSTLAPTAAAAAAPTTTTTTTTTTAAPTAASTVAAASTTTTVAPTTAAATTTTAATTMAATSTVATTTLATTTTAAPTTTTTTAAATVTTTRKAPATTAHENIMITTTGAAAAATATAATTTATEMETDTDTTVVAATGNTPNLYSSNTDTTNIPAAAATPTATATPIPAATATATATAMTTAIPLSTSTTVGIAHPIHPVQQARDELSHPHVKETADNSHFIPPMLLVKSHYVPPAKHGEHAEHWEHVNNGPLATATATPATTTTAAASTTTLPTATAATVEQKSRQHVVTAAAATTATAAPVAIVTSTASAAGATATAAASTATTTIKPTTKTTEPTAAKAASKEPATEAPQLQEITATKQPTANENSSNATTATATPAATTAATTAVKVAAKLHLESESVAIAGAHPESEPEHESADVDELELTSATTRRNFLQEETEAPFKPNRRRSLTKPETVSYFKKILG
ncbi:hypothetical protein AWZ03_012549 [Drosophila navojoa]|uniref:C-type lectin domain-containing protein n=1 Tax=Drosophila navojoa TaxID=7232 RepID=A0A484AYU5_DRONA|nr:hypothetical protein AWZ03_012549 [Drosophila navojoa]